jgi:WD40 repeat protein
VDGKKIAVGTGDTPSEVLIFDISREVPRMLARQQLGDERRIGALCWSRDGERLIIGGDRKVYEWNVSKRSTPKSIFEDFYAGAVHIAFVDDDKAFFLAAYDGDLNLVNATTHKAIHNKTLKPNTLSSAALSADGRLFAVWGPAGTLDVYSTATFKVLARSPRLQPSNMSALAFSRKMDKIAVGYWGVETGSDVVVIGERPRLPYPTLYVCDIVVK